MLHPRIGGTWLRAIGGWSDLTMSHAWPHGSDQLSLTMSAGTSHPALVRGALVQCYDGGVCVWCGRLGQPGENGSVSAVGLWDEANSVYALDGSGNATNVPDTAIDAAIARGAVTWTRPASLSAASWGTAGEPMLLVELLDKAMAGLNLRWWVDATGVVQAAADTTTPAYYVPSAAAAYGPTLVDDNYFSHLIGRYLVSTGPDVYATVTAGDTAAAARWGRREAPVDLTPMGVISGATALLQVQRRLLLTGARLGFGESLNLGYGQITTPGGTPVALTMPRAGEMVRLLGVRNPATAAPYYDIVIGRSSYKDGDATVQLSPVELSARNLSDVLQVAVA
jgi:hypothetical protein